MSIIITQSKINKNDEWINSQNINVEDFSLSIEGKKLYDSTNLFINQNNKYGFIGKNGAGKSTLLRSIYNNKIIIPPNISIFYVEQEILNSNISAVQAVLQADLKNINLLKKEQEILNKLETDDNTDELLKQLNEISNELNSINIDSFEPKARKILNGLGFTKEMQDRNVNKFSGGWQMRISLARGLFMNPDMLFLDEPTNHLDLDAVLWLNEYLLEWKNTLIIISHDQNFINYTCNNIINLENKKLNYYSCSYDKFKKMVKQDRNKLQKYWDQYQKKIKNLKKKGKYNKKNDKEYRRVKTDKGVIFIERPEREYKVLFDFNEPYKLNGQIIQMNNVSFNYPNCNTLFENIDFGIDMNDRIVIIGPNGVGKSTFMKLLIGKLNSTKGEIKKNSRCRFGIYDQHFINSLPMDKTPVEYLIEKSIKYDEINYQEARNLLGKFGLSGKAQILKNSNLSGGQKARVVFASLYIQNPNILFLDEPTNNLDIESVEALIDAINNFEGGVIIITHDIKLIEETECVLYLCNNKKIIKYDGDIEDYKDEILK